MKRKVIEARRKKAAEIQEKLGMSKYELKRRKLVEQRKKEEKTDERKYACTLCGGNVEWDRVDTIGEVTYDVYKCVDCKKEYV